MFEIVRDKVFPFIKTLRRFLAERQITMKKTAPHARRITPECTRLLGFLLATVVFAAGCREPATEPAETANETPVASAPGDSDAVPGNTTRDSAIQDDSAVAIPPVADEFLRQAVAAWLAGYEELGELLADVHTVQDAESVREQVEALADRLASARPEAGSFDRSNMAAIHQEFLPEDQRVAAKANPEIMRVLATPELDAVLGEAIRRLSG
jgi:hypothetical protein